MMSALGFVSRTGSNINVSGSLLRRWPPVLCLSVGACALCPESDRWNEACVVLKPG